MLKWLPHRRTVISSVVVGHIVQAVSATVTVEALGTLYTAES